MWSFFNLQHSQIGEYKAKWIPLSPFAYTPSPFFHFSSPSTILISPPIFLSVNFLILLLLLFWVPWERCWAILIHELLFKFWEWEEETEAEKGCLRSSGSSPSSKHFSTNQQSSTKNSIVHHCAEWKLVPWWFCGNDYLFNFNYFSYFIYLLIILNFMVQFYTICDSPPHPQIPPRQLILPILLQ